MTHRMLIAATSLGLIVGMSSAQSTGPNSDIGDTSTLPPTSSADSPTAPVATAPPYDSPVVNPGAYQAFNGAGADSPGTGLWVSSDYMLGFFQSARLPALVTTSPAGTARAQAGILGLP